MPTYLLILRFLVACLLYAALLLGIPCEWNWVMGWVFMFLTLGISSVEMIALNIKNPQLIRERMKPGGQAKPFDRILSKIVIIFGAVYLIVAGLDRRFSWSLQLPLVIQIIASVVYTLGLCFSYWAMHVNSFFSSVVRIQADRGQTVCKEGPYRIVRHPGYAGALLSYWLMPLVLSTLWVYVPVVIVTGLMILRIVLEEKTLKEELPGYVQYTKETKYRIIPGIW
jgi:protein-S-isoprenylcysteine O-methyltransferase Ste14